jgi:hypothetical protein
VVEQHAHLHAPRDRLAQRREDVVRRAVVHEDVELHVHVLARLADRRGHTRQRLLVVDADRSGVAEQHRLRAEGSAELDGVVDAGRQLPLRGDEAVVLATRDLGHELVDGLLLALALLWQPLAADDEEEQQPGHRQQEDGEQPRHARRRAAVARHHEQGDDSDDDVDDQRRQGPQIGPVEPGPAQIHARLPPLRFAERVSRP